MSFSSCLRRAGASTRGLGRRGCLDAGLADVAEARAWECMSALGRRYRGIATATRVTCSWRTTKYTHQADAPIRRREHGTDGGRRSATSPAAGRFGQSSLSRPSVRVSAARSDLSRRPAVLKNWCPRTTREPGTVPRPGATPASLRAWRRSRPRGRRPQARPRRGAGGRSARRARRRSGAGCCGRGLPWPGRYTISDTR